MAKRYKVSEAPMGQLVAPMKRENFFKIWREHAGMSQRKLAKAMGVSTGSVSRVEAGLQPFSQDFLEGYARVLGVQPTSLLGGGPQDGVLVRLNEKDLRWLAMRDRAPDAADAIVEAARHTDDPQRARWSEYFDNFTPADRAVVIEILAKTPVLLTTNFDRLIDLWGNLAEEQRDRAIQVLELAFHVALGRGEPRRSAKRPAPRPSPLRRAPSKR